MYQAYLRASPLPPVFREIRRPFLPVALRLTTPSYLLPPPPTRSMADARQRTLAKGFTIDQFNACIDEYEELNVWTVNETKTRLTFIQA